MTAKKWIMDCISAHASRIAAGKVAIHDWQEMNELDLERMCWACGGCTKKLQKCHIIPRMLGGKDNPSNIVPLCCICHDKAPDVKDQNEMWNWVEAQQNSWTSIGLGRYAWIVEMLENDPAASSVKDVDLRRFLEGFNIYLRQCGLHGGQHGQGLYIKDASIRWAINKALEPYATDGQLNLF